MQLIHIADASIVLRVDDRLNIIGTWRVKRNFRPPALMRRVCSMITTDFQLPHFDDDDIFVTDPLGCFRLLSWIISQHPRASAKQLHCRFYDLFYFNPDEALYTALCVFAGELDRPGECGFFLNQQLRNHPLEMGAISLLGMIQRQG